MEARLNPSQLKKYRGKTTENEYGEYILGILANIVRTQAVKTIRLPNNIFDLVLMISFKGITFE